jgi:hypothetical protein
MSLQKWINPFNWFTSGVKAVGGTVVDVKKAWSGSKADQDLYAHEQFVAGVQSYAAEFAPRKNRTWWDSLWDGINRMPRPLIVIAIFWYFSLSYRNPTEFQVLNTALETVPERMWWIMSAVVSFYFVAREFQKDRDTKMALSDKEFGEVQKRIAKLREAQINELPPKEEGYVNPSIEAWKKKQSGT